MKKHIGGILLGIMAILVVCTGVYAEEFAGTYKFTNTSDATAYITFDGAVDSDVITYNSSGQIVSYTPYENIKSGGSISLYVGNSCIINNINSDITVPEGVVWDKSDKTELITRYDIKSDAGHGYLVSNTYDYQVNIGVMSMTSGKTILYEKDGMVVEYGYDFNMKNNSHNSLSSGRSRYIEGSDGQLFLPKDSGITFTECSEPTRFNQYTLSTSKNYLISNNSDRNQYIRSTKSASCTTILYDKNNNIVEYGDGFALHSYQGSGLGAGYTRWITGMDTEIYYPTEIGITITEAEPETRFIRIPLSVGKNYLISNNSDKNQHIRSTKSASCTTILYDNNNNVTEYGDGFALHSYQGSGLRAGYTRWITGMDTEIYYPTEFGITITEAEPETRFTRIPLSVGKNYLISNNSDKNQHIRLTKSASCTTILYDKNNNIVEYIDGFSLYSYQGSRLDAGYTRWMTGADTEVYYPAEFGITVTEAEAESRLAEFDFEEGKAYSIENTLEKKLWLRIRTADSVGITRHKPDGRIYEYALKNDFYSYSSIEIPSKEKFCVENCNVGMYYPKEFGFIISELSEGLFNKYTLKKDKSYRIENKTEYNHGFTSYERFYADVITYGSNNILSGYEQNKNINTYYGIGKNSSCLLTEAEAEIYVPRELEEAGLFTITEEEYVDAIEEISLSGDKAYELKNNGSYSVYLQTTGLETLKRIVYNADGNIKEYSASKGSKVNGITVSAGQVVILEGGEGTIKVPFEYRSFITLNEKSNRYFTAIALTDGEAVRIDNSNTSDIYVLADGHEYSIITFTSESQKKYIQSQNKDFTVYRSKYALIKNVSGEAMVLYIPRELSDRYIKYSYVSPTVFDTDVLGSYVSFDITRKYVTGLGITDTFSDIINSYKVTCYNNTQGKAVACEKNLQGVYLNEGDVAPYDNITFTLVSNSIKDASVTIVLDENCHGEAVINVVELGRIMATVSDEEMTNEYHLSLYDANGKAVLRERMVYGTSSFIRDGSYTAVFIRKKGSDPYFPRFEDIDSCELIENIHYVKASVTVNAGEYSYLDFQELPLISDDDLSYLIFDETKFEVSATTSSNNDIAKLTFSYETKKGALAGLNYATFEIDIDTRMQVYEDEIYVNGEKVGCSWYNRRLYVNLPKDKGTLEIYMKVLRNDTYEFKPKITFKGSAINKTEIIAPYKFSNKLITLYTQVTVGAPQVKLTGTSFAEKPVYIYCDGQLLTQTVAGKNGAYDVNAILPWAFAGKEYVLYATDGEGNKSDDVDVVYMPNKPSLKEFVLKVYRGGKPDVIDLLSDELYSYVFPLNWDFCYEAEFDGPALEDVFVVNKSGKYLKMYYDEASGKFTTTPKPKGDFVIADTVTFIYNGPYHTNSMLGLDEKLKNMPPVVLKSVKTATDMPLSAIPQDILDACKGVADPEHYIKLSLASLSEAGEDVSFTFDLVLCEEEPASSVPSISGGAKKYSDTVIGTNKAFLSIDSFAKAMFGSDYRTASELVFRSDQMRQLYNSTYASTSGRGLSYGGQEISYGRPVANMHDYDYYRRICEDNQQYVEDNYGGNPLPGNQWDEFKDGVADMAGDVAATAYGAKGAIDGYNDTKDLTDRVLALLYSVSGPDPDAEKKSVIQYFDEAFLVPKFFSFDPSGYVYEGYEENRIEGVTVTAYYDGENGEKVLWNAEEWGQKNPLRTDEYGAYAWDVPEGVWSVKYEKDGYITAWREGLVVPPPRTEVNMGLVATVGAGIESVISTDDGIVVTFTKPVMAEDISKESVMIIDNSLLIDAETVAGDCYESDFGVITKTAIIKTYGGLTSGREYSVLVTDGVRTYNGITAKSSRSYLHKAIKLLSETDKVNLNENDSATVVFTLTGEDTSDSEIYVTDSGTEVCSYTITQTGDNVILTITGIAMGSETLTIGVKDTKISKKITVNVYPENYNFNIDRKMTYNSYEKMLTISSPTKVENATLLVCRYDSNARFEGVKAIENITLDARDNLIDMHDTITGNEYAVKFMLVDSLSGMKPFVKAAKY